MHAAGGIGRLVIQENSVDRFWYLRGHRRRCQPPRPVLRYRSQGHTPHNRVRIGPFKRPIGVGGPLWRMVNSRW